MVYPTALLSDSAENRYDAVAICLI